MSSTPIDFPRDRSQLDPALNPGTPLSGPLQDGDRFDATGTAFVWKQDAGETYGRWRNDDPGATGDDRYVLKNPYADQTITGAYQLSINDNIELDGSDGSAEFAGQVSLPGGGTGAEAIQVQEVETLVSDSVSKSDLNSQNISSDLTIGTDKITLNASDGSATFAGTVVSGGTPDTSNNSNNGTSLNSGKIFTQVPTGFGDTNEVYGQYYGTASAVSFKANGSATFAGNVRIEGGITAAGSQISEFFGTQSDSTTAFEIRDNSGANYYYTVTTDGSVWIGNKTGTGGNYSTSNNANIQLKADGSATFDGTITISDPVGGSGHIFGDGGGAEHYAISTAADSTAVLKVGKGNTANATIKADGSATFAGFVKANGLASDLYMQSKEPGSGGAVLCSGGFAFRGYQSSGGNDFATPTYGITYAGTASFRGISIDLEPDNDDNYVTTMVDGEEQRVYNGPTLDVKAVIQDLQQRLADRDAVITNLTTRIQTLEANTTPAPTPQPTPTPAPTNLIPDEWSHIEKLKALKELISEMNL